MWSLFKKLFSVLLVLYLVALILNIKIGGRPTREWTQRAWRSEGVQKVYTTVRDRVLALIRKDISVEDVFKSDLNQKDKSTASKLESGPGTGTVGKSEIREIDLEQLTEQDRQSLEIILDKASKKKN